MKLSFFTYSIIVLAVIFGACQKVKEDLRAQYDQPSVTLTGITLPDGTYLTYPKDARPGDTLTIAGRLNLSKGAVIRLGKQSAVIIDSSSFQVKYPAIDNNYLMETARFVVTSEMGTGLQPLTVTCGAYHVQAPDINIIVQSAGGSQPDTTLMVTQVFDGSGTEAYMERYKPYGNTYIDVALGLTRDGTVYFASKKDIYRIRNNSMEWLLKQEDSLTIAGKKYPITQIIGMTPDPGNTDLYFSFYSEVNAPDNYNRIYWLVKKNLSGGALTVINKTEVEYLPNGLVSGVTRPQGNVYGKVPVSQMPVYAYDLKVDVKGRLLFFNNNIHNNGREIEYYCRMDPSSNNVVTPLYEMKSSLAGVFKCEMSMGYTQDGLFAYVVHEQNEVWPFSSGITVMDLESREPSDYIDAKVNITYASFDPVPERQMKLKSAFIHFPSSGVLPGDQLPLSGKELLFVNGYSIASVNAELAYLYAYAGMEAGCAPSGTSDAILLPEQNQKVGPAKYVDFSGGPLLGGRVRLLGQDAAGAVYFLRGGQYATTFLGGLKRYYLPPTVYKISKP